MNLLWKCPFEEGQVIKSKLPPYEQMRIVLKRVDTFNREVLHIVDINTGWEGSFYSTAFELHWELDEKATILFGGGQKNGGGLI